MKPVKTHFIGGSLICYDSKLARHLTKKGFRHLIFGYDDSNKRKFALYTKTTELAAVMAEYNDEQEIECFDYSLSGLIQ